MTTADRALWRPFLVFLLPMMATNILQSLSGTINNILLGRLIGTHALAAAATFFPVMFLFIAFLVGLSAGARVLIGQAWGAKEPLTVKSITGSVLTVTFLGGLAIGIGASLAAAPIMRGLGTPADIFDDAVAFARVSFLSLPLLFVFLVSASMLRGVGDTLTPLTIQVLATVLSALTTAALIQGWLGLPRLGILSAAVSGPISFGVSVVALGAYLRYRRHPMAPDRVLFERLRPDPRLLRLVLKIGLPTGLQVIVGAVSGLVIVGLVNSFGSDATAAYGAVSQVFSYAQFPALSVGITTSIFGAQMIGAGRIHRLGDVLRTGLVLNLLLTGTLVAIIYLFSRPIVGLFVTDADVAALAERLLHTVVWSSLLFGTATVFSGLMRASGVVLVPMIIGIACILGIELPVAYLMAGRIGLPGIWWGFVGNFAVLMCAQALYYHFVWKKKRIARMV